MQILSMLKRLVSAVSEPCEQRECELAWRRDPLSHPVIEAMCERQLADLPFHPRRTPGS